MAKRKKSVKRVDPATQPVFVNGMWNFDLEIKASEFQIEKKKKKRKKHKAFCSCSSCIAKLRRKGIVSYGEDDDDFDDYTEEDVRALNREIQTLQNRIHRLDDQLAVARHELRELHREDGGRVTCAHCAAVFRQYSPIR